MGGLWPNPDMSMSNCLLPFQASQSVLDLSFADTSKSGNGS